VRSAAGLVTAGTFAHVAGSYDSTTGQLTVYVNGVATSTITLNVDNTWVWNGQCDGGAWGTIGSTVALDDSACGTTSLPSGAAFIAHVNTHGHLGTKADPGTVDFGGTVDSWYAAPAGAAASDPATSKRSALAATGSTAEHPAVVAPGTFNFYVNGVSYNTITLNSDNTWQINNGNCDGGSWVALNNVVALSDSSCYGQLPDGGIWMATSHPKGGLGTAKLPGFADDPYAVTFSWYATPTS